MFNRRHIYLRAIQTGCAKNRHPPETPAAATFAHCRVV
jgi:hypothetical protein